jgi:phosphate transport system protein
MADDAETTGASMPHKDLRSSYHHELDRLKTGVVRLGALACETIPRGTEVLLGGSLSDAQQLIDDDDEIDGLAVELEEQCINVIALQAPVAGELRKLMTITKMIAEIERSADLMVNICKSSRRMYGASLTPRVRGVLGAMASEANKMLRLSIDAFADENASLGVALDDIDDELDQLNREIVEAIFEGHHTGDIGLAEAVQLALIARYYERIGDHAVNIGGWVNYMVTGWMPEYNGMLRAEHRKEQTGDEVDGDDPGAPPRPGD